jgi:hypothetical protein
MQLRAVIFRSVASHPLRDDSSLSAVTIHIAEDPLPLLIKHFHRLIQ